MADQTVTSVIWSEHSMRRSFREGPATTVTMSVLLMLRPRAAREDCGWCRIHVRGARACPVELRETSVQGHQIVTLNWFHVFLQENLVLFGQLSLFFHSCPISFSVPLLARFAVDSCGFRDFLIVPHPNVGSKANSKFSFQSFPRNHWPEEITVPVAFWLCLKRHISTTSL